MKNRFSVLLVSLCLPMAATIAHAGPYAPAAGVAETTAVHMDDASFVAWATGYQDYIVGADVAIGWQTPDKALGVAVESSYDIVCLGNGGSIVLTFDSAIANGDGYDFAVFENSFNDTFLELGYVEVSSNGTDYFRFSNDSLTASAVSAYGAVDPTNIDGLAGKYKQGYGTPFDLSTLTYDEALLDIESILYVRIVDIIGDGTYTDTSGDIIYDPHKTTGSGGFDLDAVGVINQASPVPVPAAAWLLGCGLMGLVGLKRKS